MPRPRVKIELWNADAAKLQAAIDYIQARLPAANRFFDKPFDWTRGVIPGVAGSAACWDGRLLVDTDAQAIWTTLQNYVSTLQANGFKAHLTYHQCSHGDPAVTTCSGFEVTL